MFVIGIGNGDFLVVNICFFFLGFINFELDMLSVWCSFCVILFCYNKYKMCLMYGIL